MVREMWGYSQKSTCRRAAVKHGCKGRVSLRLGGSVTRTFPVPLAAPCHAACSRQATELRVAAGDIRGMLRVYHVQIWSVPWRLWVEPAEFDYLVQSRSVSVNTAQFQPNRCARVVAARRELVVLWNHTTPRHRLRFVRVTELRSRSEPSPYTR